MPLTIWSSANGLSPALLDQATFGFILAEGGNLAVH